MGIKKGVAPNRNFTQIPNDLIRNQQVTDGAFRLICWITSHSEGFDISFSGIRAALGYGRDGLRSIIKNAEENNYLVRVRSRDEQTGQFDWDYHIFAHQQDAIAFRKSIYGLDTPGDTIDGSTTPGSPSGGSPTGGLNHPHKEYKDVEDKSKKNKSKNIPLTPQRGEEGVHESKADDFQQEQEQDEEESKAVAVEFEIVKEEIKNEINPSVENGKQAIQSINSNPGGENKGGAARDNKTRRLQRGKCLAPNPYLEQKEKSFLDVSPRSRNFHHDGPWGLLATELGLPPQKVSELLHRWLVQHAPPHVKEKGEKNLSDYVGAIRTKWFNVIGSETGNWRWEDFRQILVTPSQGVEYMCHWLEEQERKPSTPVDKIQTPRDTMHDAEEMERNRLERQRRWEQQRSNQTNSTPDL